MRRILAWLFVVLLGGGHLALLQGVAWAGMFLARLPTAADAGAALAATVDGSAPCALCKAVDELAKDKPAGKKADENPKKPDARPVAIWHLPPAGTAISMRAFPPLPCRGRLPPAPEPPPPTA